MSKESIFNDKANKRRRDREGAEAIKRKESKGETYG